MSEQMLKDAIALKEQRRQEDDLISKIPDLEQEIENQRIRQAEYREQAEVVFNELIARYQANHSRLDVSVNMLLQSFEKLVNLVQALRWEHSQLYNASIQLTRQNSNGDNWNIQGMSQQKLIDAGAWPVASFKPGRSLTDIEKLIAGLLAECGINFE